MSFIMRVPRFVGMSGVDPWQSGLRQLVTFRWDNGLVSIARRARAWRVQARPHGPHRHATPRVWIQQQKCSKVRDITPHTAFRTS